MALSDQDILDFVSENPGAGRDAIRKGVADVNKRTPRVASNIPLLKSDLAPMSFTTMDDNEYIDGLIGIYKLNNVALLREVYIDAYLASAEKYRSIRAEVESPEKAALAYREFVRAAVRRCVLEFKAFREVSIMSSIPKFFRITFFLVLYVFLWMVVMTSMLQRPVLVGGGS